MKSVTKDPIVSGESEIEMSGSQVEDGSEVDEQQTHRSLAMTTRPHEIDGEAKSDEISSGGEGAKPGE